MEKKKYAIIMAAGSGVRMGGPLPKQFMNLEGRSILQRTIERMVEACPDVKIVTVLPRDMKEYWMRQCLERNFQVPQIIVEGGITRFHSVRNALSKVPDGTLVAIHDGVRPLVTADLIRRMFSMLEDIGSLIPVVPVVDTLKILDRGPDGTLSDTGEKADRSRVFGAQTPQMFFSEEIRDAYSQAYSTGFTDDASVFYAKGKALTYVEGERFNIKITAPEDLELARAILKIRGEY